MKIMIMAGGTGGHVFPALAVAQYLRAQGHSIVWMGAPESFESRVIPPQGFPMEFVRVSGLRGKGVGKLLRAPLLLGRAFYDAWQALRRQRPDVVLGMGGFAAGPGGLVAWMQRIPLCIHEQNAAAGLTNRLLAHIATRVLEAFPGTFSGALTVGNPVRQGFAEITAPEQRIHRDGVARVLVIGGSQGSKSLNELMPKALAAMDAQERPQVLHQAGRTLKVAQQAYAAAGVTADVRAFIDDMPTVYANADLVVCRSGASTVAELGVAGCASLLVPYPHAVDDHQTRNGEFLVKAGAAQLVQECDLNPGKLAALLKQTLADRAQLIRMGQAARRTSTANAAQIIANECLACAKTAKGTSA